MPPQGLSKAELQNFFLRASLQNKMAGGGGMMPGMQGMMPQQMMMQIQNMRQAGMQQGP
eukprot:CAMPEP_0180178818 /NCGR_PEP_ID=MMETSP0986-20121125/38665_1 /TAXON_ID=697907 /ORGANISM="non described non described, Strain CCMP2293" /LENGTH=58 /DNA_ID=CAMNT_0022131805 /DNA_START=27 /DNA_END=199 /DNA_ORIENTATION=+